MIMECFRSDAEEVAFEVPSGCLAVVELPLVCPVVVEFQSVCPVVVVDFPLELTRPVQVVFFDPVEVERDSQ